MDNNLGSVIAHRRIQKDLSQRELALAVNVSNSTIARIERGDSIVPGNETLRAIARTLDLDYNYLLALCKQIDDEPEIRMIQRAAHKMSPADKARMVEILRLAFQDAFSNTSSDEEYFD